MAARPTHDLAVKTGEYQDRNGQTKGRWQRIGTVFRHDDGGTSIKLDCLPVGIPEWDGWVNVFKREEAGQGAQTETGPQRGFGGTGYHQARAQGRASGPPPAPEDFDDDIPF